MAGSSSSASTDEKFPSESLSDWVSYAQQVSVVTVVGEAQVPPPQEVWDRQEGYVGRTVTVRIERDLWTAPGVVSLRGDQTMLDWGWLLKGEKLTPLTSAMQVGQRYLVPLGVSRGKLGSTLTTPIGVDGDRLAGKIDSSHAWIRDLAGKPLADLQASLATAVADPVAVQFANLDPADRVEAVRAAKFGQGAAPSPNP